VVVLNGAVVVVVGATVVLVVLVVSPVTVVVVTEGAVVLVVLVLVVVDAPEVSPMTSRTRSPKIGMRPQRAGAQPDRRPRLLPARNGVRARVGSVFHPAG